MDAKNLVNEQIDLRLRIKAGSIIIEFIQNS
jgi:hypothetical protein